jgi:hypothetical protein
MIKLALIGLALWFFDLWPFSVGAPLDFQTEYIPEVVYMVGAGETSFLGPRIRSRDACIDLAHSQARHIAERSRSRVVSTHCRVMRGDSFLDRVR